MSQDTYTLDVVLPCAATAAITTASGQIVEVGEKVYAPPTPGGRSELHVVSMPLEMLSGFSAVVVKPPQVFLACFSLLSGKGLGLPCF